MRWCLGRRTARATPRQTVKLSDMGDPGKWRMLLRGNWESAMRVGLMTREYPPEVYGGAGVHVEYLSRELAKLIEVEVHCWGTQRADEGNLHVIGDEPPAE